MKLKEFTIRLVVLMVGFALLEVLFSSQKAITVVARQKAAVYSVNAGADGYVAQKLIEDVTWSTGIQLVLMFAWVFFLFRSLFSKKHEDNTCIDPIRRAPRSGWLR